MSARHGGPSIVGVGVVACAACCAPPLLAFFVGSSVAAVGGALFGLLGAAVAVAGLGWVMIRRRRRQARPRAVAKPVSLPNPTRRPT